MDDLTAKYNHIIHTISGMMQLHETGVNDDLPYSMIIFTGFIVWNKINFFCILFGGSGLSILLTMIMTTILLPK